MKVKIKTTDSYYDKFNGYSKVIISTDLGEFEGHAQLHPDDKDIASRYAGCRYAEMRASIKYIKTKIRIVKAQLKTLYNILNDIKNKSNYNTNNFGVKRLLKEIYLLEDEKEKLNNGIENINKALNKAIEERPKIINNIKKRKQDK